ncbi:MAG: hypothetical protein IPJ66_04490 [Bacteroidetes bacterium]|nr:hypothetical protein [Bacteroidota bacterium]MBL0066435.1 hypothetical protein [Bacteroidota bacterium]
MIFGARREAIIRAIDNIPEIRGCAIGYYGDDTCEIIRNAIPPRADAVLVEESTINVPSASLATSATTELPDIPDGTMTNRSRISAEATSLTLGVTFTIIGFGLLAIASGPIGWIAAGGAIIGGIQTGVSAGRLYVAITDPDTNSLQELDNDAIYAWSIRIIDALGILAGAAGILEVLRSGGFMRLSSQEFARLSQSQQRAALAEALRRGARSREVRAAFEQYVQAAERTAASSSRIAADSLHEAYAGARTSLLDELRTAAHARGRAALAAHLSRVENLLQTERNISNAIMREFQVGVITGAGQYIVNGMDSSIVGSSSGLVNELIVSPAASLLESRPGSPDTQQSMIGECSESITRLNVCYLPASLFNH